MFSTVGDRRVFERLPQGRVKPALALSLHTTDADLRARLLPKAPRIDPEELVELGERYARATGYPIQYQWTLLDGVNDGEAEIEALIRLLSGKYAMMNFIPFNTVEGLAFRRPAWGEGGGARRSPAPARHHRLPARLGRAGYRRRLRAVARPQPVGGQRGQQRKRLTRALSSPEMRSRSSAVCAVECIAAVVSSTIVGDFLDLLRDAVAGNTLLLRRFGNFAHAGEGCLRAVLDLTQGLGGLFRRLHAGGDLRQRRVHDPHHLDSLGLDAGDFLLDLDGGPRWYVRRACALRRQRPRSRDLAHRRRAASMAALSASRLVCPAISLMTPAIDEIWLARSSSV